jgi:hypothetical protein
MSTYAQEKAAKLRERAKTAKRYVFHAAGYDLFDAGPYTPDNGTVVIKTQPHGCPRNGTMGQCYIANLEGEFLGMVDLRSLTPVRRSR